MERSASAHVREELVARLVHDGDVAALKAVDDVPVDVPLQEVDDEFYAAPPYERSSLPLPSVLEEEEEEPRVLLWQKGNYLGSGSFGDAFLALNLENGEHYVVKQVHLESDQPECIPDVMALQQEISFLQTLSHPNIVRYICSTIEGDTLNIFQVSVRCGDSQRPDSLFSLGVRSRRFDFFGTYALRCHSREGGT